MPRLVCMVTKQMMCLKQTQFFIFCYCPEMKIYGALNKHPGFHCVKSVQIWSFSSSYFPVFGLNTEI